MPGTRVVTHIPAIVDELEASVYEGFVELDCHERSSRPLVDCAGFEDTRRAVNSRARWWQEISQTRPLCKQPHFVSPPCLSAKVGRQYTADSAR